MSRSASSRVGSVNGIRGPTFQIGGNTRFLANPSRSVQHAENNTGALTRNEASAIGLHLVGHPSGPLSGDSRALPGFPKLILVVFEFNFFIKW